jgi:hypothetical protein
MPLPGVDYDCAAVRRTAEALVIGTAGRSLPTLFLSPCICMVRPLAALALVAAISFTNILV